MFGRDGLQNPSVQPRMRGLALRENTLGNEFANSVQYYPGQPFCAVAGGIGGKKRKILKRKRLNNVCPVCLREVPNSALRNDAARDGKLESGLYNVMVGHCRQHAA